MSTSEFFRVSLTKAIGPLPVHADHQERPLAQIADASFVLEPPLIWRRQRLPTVTVQADIPRGMKADTVIQQLAEPIEEFRKQLPPGYSVAVGGVTEDSAKSQASIAAGCR